MPSAARRAVRKLGRPPNPPNPLLAARIRALREGAGMTQAALAGADFTKGFISLIETQRTGLSLRAARIIASRLSVSVDELLQPERATSQRKMDLAMARAEADLAAGRLDEAMTSSADAASSDRVDMRARYARLKGRVLLAKDRPTEAIPELAEALRLFRQAHVRDVAARTLFDLAQAYARSEAPGQAAAYGLECEQALSAGDLIDASLEMRLMAFLAGLFVTMGDRTSADVRIERARRLAEDVAEPHGVGNLYYNLAVLRQEEGDSESALRFALSALDAYERLGVQAHLGSVWNTIGWIHVQRRQFGKAKEALARAAALAKESGDRRLAAYVVQTQAESELARGDPAAALRLADASINDPHSSTRCRATSLLVKAQALAASGAKVSVVSAAFAEAASALEPFGRELVARAHRAHFEALMARNAPEATAAAAAAFAALSPRGE